MSGEKKSEVEVQVVVFKEVLREARTIALRSESTIKDHYEGAFQLGDYDLSNVMDVKISSKVLITRLEELIEQTVEAGVHSVFLPPAEVKMIANLIGALGVAGKSQFANTNMREH